MKSTLHEIYGHGEDMVFLGNAAFIACGIDGIRIVDLSLPANPGFLGVMEIPRETVRYYMPEYQVYSTTITTDALGVAIDKRGYVCVAYGGKGLVIAGEYSLPLSATGAGIRPANPQSAKPGGATGLPPIICSWKGSHSFFGVDGRRIPEASRRGHGILIERAGTKMTARLFLR
jgi:hypothetical protein